MKMRSLGLSLALCAGLAPLSARAELTLSIANGQTASFGLTDCKDGAKRYVQYQGATAANELKIFFSTGSCPETAPTDAVFLLEDDELESDELSRTLTKAVTAEDLTGDGCPAAKTIEKRICAVARYEVIDLYGKSEWKVGAKAELVLTYDSEPPDAPVLSGATGGEGQLHLSWTGDDESDEWEVCLKKVGEPIPQSDDPCASFASQSQAATDASCSDGTQNNLETDQDCGGTLCDKCADTKKCLVATDCASQVCSGEEGAAKTCQAATCEDSVENGTETDVDCGGDKCGGCAEGKACAEAGDCASGLCTDKLCAKAVNENPLTGCDVRRPFSGSATRKGTVDGLVNGQKYSLQLAARDAAGNYSPASNTIEATPQLVFDFYERYRCSGGTEAGGFGCSSAGAALLPLAGLAALGLLRRRRDGRNAQ